MPSQTWPVLKTGPGRKVSIVGVIVAGLVMATPSPTTLRAQTRVAERPQSFEVASVKENTSGDSRSPIRTQPGGRLVATNVLVKFLIAEAFMGAQPVHLSSRILGGPDWIASARYDITAKASSEFRMSPDGPPRELLAMLRSLLEERFKLKAHYETREMPIYELVVARADGKLGPQLRRSTASCDSPRTFRTRSRTCPASFRPRRPGRRGPGSASVRPARQGGAALRGTARHDRGARPPHRRTPRSDVIVGRAGPDLILGLGGQAIISASGAGPPVGRLGRDRLIGGGGSDRCAAAAAGTCCSAVPARPARRRRRADSRSAASAPTGSASRAEPARITTTSGN